MKLLALFLLLTMPMRIYKDTTLPPNGEYRQPIIIMADNVTLNCQNSTIIGEGVGVGILVQNRRNVTIRNCRVRGWDVGMYVVRGSNFRIENNDFSGNFLDDNSNIEHLKPIPHGGLILNGIQNSRVVGNIANGNVAGIQIANSRQILVQSNTTNRNRGWGIYLYGTTASQIYSNTVDYNNRSCEWGKDAGCGSAGIVLTNKSDRNKVAWNSLNYNGDGIYQGNHNNLPSNDNEMMFNKISNSVANGIEATFGTGNYIHNNEMIDDNYGSWFGYAQNLRFEYNTVKNSKENGVEAPNAQNHRYVGNKFIGANLILRFEQSNEFSGTCQGNIIDKTNEFTNGAVVKTPDCK